MKKLIPFLSTILLASTIWSCGARKKEKSNLTENVKTEQTSTDNETSKEESNVKSQTETKADSQTGTKTIKTTYEPIDKEKPATVEKNGKKTILHNSKLTEEESVTNNTTAKNEKSNTQSATKKEAAKQRQASQKTATKKETGSLSVKRDAVSWLNLLWLLIPMGLYWVWKRYLGRVFGV